MGATTLLTTYELDIWLTGSDSSGNSFDVDSNSAESPFASWPLALIGPSIDLSSSKTQISWDNPSPYVGDIVTLEIQSFNEGSKGNVTFVLENLDLQGNWVEVAKVSQVVNQNSTMYTTIQYLISQEQSTTLEFRVLALIDDIEMDR